jgi:hypothetical protein
MRVELHAGYVIWHHGANNDGIKNTHMRYDQDGWFAGKFGEFTRKLDSNPYSAKE